MYSISKEDGGYHCYFYVNLECSVEKSYYTTTCTQKIREHLTNTIGACEYVGGFDRFYGFKNSKKCPNVP